uniref:Uncharacterized protein n=1 Tax=Pogona vitticeps TaxID=103695 RepID=A0ABM5ER34_9SAUR
MNGTSTEPLTCQSFQCSGERCYQLETLGNRTETCHNATLCELFRLNSTSYTAQCSQECGGANATEMCGRNGDGSDLSPCTLECCSTSNCLRLNATAYGDLPTTTTPAPTTTTTTITTTTTPAPPRNGKVCTSFTCHGEGCYRGQKAAASCTVGFDFCEMKKTGPHFVAGCSRRCQKAGPACTPKSTVPCYQECCPATPKTSCLKLDGRVHFNGAGGPLAYSPQLLWLALLGLAGMALPFLARPN